MAAPYKSTLERLKPTLLAVAAGAFIVQASLQIGAIFPKWRADYAPKTLVGEGLSPDQLLLTLAGFREMIAGILWVRADSFFDQGNYDAILPIIRLVTILDPRQIDVYATGMWHIGYNFTDEESRSDRRYIPSALALGKEGAKNNPYTYEMFFETGWMWYHKVDDDYHQAVNWFTEATKREDMLPARRNLLGMAHQRNGDVEKQAEYMEGLLAEAQKKYDEDLKQNPQAPNFQLRQNRDTIEQNLDNHYVRMAQRGYFAQKRGDFATGDYDTKPPFNINFSARVTVIEPRVLRVQGTWGVLPVGTRVRFILRDSDYPGAVPGGMQWDLGNEVSLDPPKDVTFLQDALFVRDQRFDRNIDMSRDPTMYPLNKDKYVLEFYYNPRSAPAHMQDKFGFNGEGMTDTNYLRTDVRENQRVIFARLELTKQQLFRTGEYDVSGGKTPVVETKGFRARTATELRTDIMKVPGLRAAE